MNRLTRTLVTATALALPLTVVATVAGPAEAANACVTKKEFRTVKNGMALSNVHRIFDTNGKQSFVSGTYQAREYKVCGSRYGFVWIDFERKRVYNKTAYWG